MKDPRSRMRMTFNVGPAQLGPHVPDDIKEALENGFGSLSHRSPLFKEFYAKARNEIFKYFSLPDDWKIYFVGSGSEAMETAARGLIHKRSLHHVNGNFSKRAHIFAEMIGRDAILKEAPELEGFTGEPEKAPEGTDCVFFTKTETATGVSTSWDYIHAFKEKNPAVMVVCDIVPVAPTEPLTSEFVDFYFFSVQKGVGLPAGLGVALCSPQACEKAHDLQKQGVDVGANHSIPMLEKFAKDDFTHDTPNVMSIHLLGRAFERFNEKGVETIEKETIEKSEFLYNWLENSELFLPGVSDPALRARSAAAVKFKAGVEESAVMKAADDAGYEVGAGYGHLKGTMIRIANFPAHSIDDLKELSEALEKTKVSQAVRA